MRKLIASLLLLASLPMVAQEIVIDDVQSGVRSTATDFTVCRSVTDKMVLSVGINSIISEEKKDTTLYLSTKITFTKPLEINKGGTILLKLSDDSVMELHAATASSGTVRDVHSVNGFTYSDYSITPSFKILPEQLNDIIKKGVKKIRIEISPSFYDKEFKKDKVGEALSVKRELLMKAIAKPKSMKEGF